MDAVFKLLDKVEVLPPSAALFSRLLPALSDVDSNLDEVVRLIELDPSLTAKLLHICNSAFFGAAEPVTNARDAVGQLGYQPVYLLASMISGSDCFRLPVSAGQNPGRLWKHSIVAAYATKFAAETVGANDNLLFTAGLLHDIGKIVLFKARPDQYAVLLREAAQARTSPAALEFSSYGYNHAEVGAALLERWKLPAPLVTLVGFHHNPAAAPSPRETACVYLGNLVAHSGEYPQPAGSGEYADVLSLAALTPRDISDCEERVRDQGKIIEEVCRLRM